MTAKVFGGLICNELIPGNEDLQMFRRIIDTFLDLPSSPQIPVDVTFFPQADHYGLAGANDRLEVGELGDVVAVVEHVIVSIECKYLCAIGDKVRTQVLRQRQYLDSLARNWATTANPLKEYRQMLVYADYPNRRPDTIERVRTLGVTPVTWRELLDVVQDMLPPQIKASRFWDKRNVRTIERVTAGQPTSADMIRYLQRNPKRTWGLFD